MVFYLTVICPFNEQIKSKYLWAQGSGRYLSIDGENYFRWEFDSIQYENTLMDGAFMCISLYRNAIYQLAIKSAPFSWIIAMENITYWHQHDPKIWTQITFLHLMFF